MRLIKLNQTHIKTIKILQTLISKNFGTNLEYYTLPAKPVNLRNFIYTISLRNL